MCILKHERKVNALSFHKNVFTTHNFHCTFSLYTNVGALRCYSTAFRSVRFFYCCVFLILFRFNSQYRSFDHNVWLVVLFAFSFNIFSASLQAQIENNKYSGIEKEWIDRATKEMRKSLHTCVCVQVYIYICVQWNILSGV